MATIFQLKGGKALFYSSGDSIHELGTGRPLYYRGLCSNVFFSYDGGVPTFWIESSQEGSERLPLGGIKGYLYRYDGEPPHYFEEEPAVEEIAAELFGE